MKHLKTGEIVTLNNKYVEDLLKTADQYSSEVVCGKEDKFYTQKQIDDAKKKTKENIDILLRSTPFQQLIKWHLRWFAF